MSSAVSSCSWSSSFKIDSMLVKAPSVGNPFNTRYPCAVGSPTSLPYAVAGAIAQTLKGIDLRGESIPSARTDAQQRPESDSARVARRATRFVLGLVSSRQPQRSAWFDRSLSLGRTHAVQGDTID